MHHASPAGSPTRAWASTSAPAASSPWRWPRGSRPSASGCTATTSPSPSSGGRSMPASGRSSSTPSTRSSGWRRWPSAAGVRQRVLVRVTVGVEAHTHEFIATAHEDQKFGFSLRDGAALRAVEAVLAQRRRWTSPACTRTSARRSSRPPAFEVAAHRVVGLAATIRDTHGIEVDEINLGGGLGIAYVTGDDPEAPKLTLERLHRHRRARVRARRAAHCPASRSSRDARSSAPARSPSTRSGRSRTSRSTAA